MGLLPGSDAWTATKNMKPAAWRFPRFRPVVTAAVFYGYGSHELRDDRVTDSFPVHRPADLVDLIQEQYGASERQALE